MIRALVALATVLLPGLVHADEVPAPGSSGIGGPGHVPKLEMAKRLLADPATTRRIDSSDNDEAMHLWASAQEKVDQAEALLGGNDGAAAEPLLNAALKQIGLARRAVADPAPQRTERHLRYGRLFDSVQSYYASYQRRAKESGSAAEEDEAARIRELIANAGSMAADERTDDALSMLEAAEKSLLIDLNRLLGSATIDDTHRSGSPAEIYEYQMARNRSYAELVPVAIAQLRPAPDAHTLIDRNVQENLRLRDQARQLAAGKDYQSAIDLLVAGTANLQRALTLAGLASAPSSRE